MKSLIILVIWFFYKRSHKLIRGKFGLKYVATTKYNLINKVLELYIQYHFINLINHALNNDDLIFEHWMNICAFLVLSIHFLVLVKNTSRTLFTSYASVRIVRNTVRIRPGWKTAKSSNYTSQNTLV